MYPAAPVTYSFNRQSVNRLSIKNLTQTNGNIHKQTTNGSKETFLSTKVNIISNNNVKQSSINEKMPKKRMPYKYLKTKKEHCVQCIKVQSSCLQLITRININYYLKDQI